MKTQHLMLALLLVGCAETSGDTPRNQALESAPEFAPEDRRAANEHERAMKRAEEQRSPSGPIAQEIDWAETAGFKKIDPKLLPTPQAEKLAAVSVPVLAFDDAGLLETALLTHHQKWYVLAVEADGLNMNVRGTRNARIAPKMVLSEGARKAAENYTLTRTHAIVTVSWRAFNASYSLDIECAKPLADPRCTEDEFALQTVERLGVIGGQP